MEKKRKREKATAAAAAAAAAAANDLDAAHAFQELQNTELLHKPPITDLPSTSLPFHAWQYQQQQQSAAGAQTPQTAQVPQTQEPTVSQPVAYVWPYSDYPRPPYFAVPPPPSTDPSWIPPPPAQTATQAAAAGAPPNPYPFPPPGAWYAAYPPPPYSGYFGYPAPANSSSHRGFIKPPQGMSQKHQKLWEVQSTENIQLWAALARAEAELSTQRSKLAQLEADIQNIQSLKQKTSNPEITTTNAITVTTSAEAAVAPLAVPIPSSSVAKPRGRYRKPVMGNIPPESIAPRPRGRKPSTDKFRQAKPLLASATDTAQTGGVAMSFTATANPANGVSSANPQLQQHPAASSFAALDKLRSKLRENGGSTNFRQQQQQSDLNVNSATTTTTSATATTASAAGQSKNGGASVMSSSWAPMIQVAAAAAAARGEGNVSEEDDDGDEDDDVVLTGSTAAPNAQVRW